MAKQILIIGGGISGLSVLHYLKLRLGAESGVHVHLLEKETHVGGAIRTVERNGVLFETGPNGFLNSKDSMLGLIKEIGLGDQTVTANTESRTRYLSLANRLYPLPTGPGSFLTFPLLTLFQKIRVLGDFAVERGIKEEETVFEFGCRRFGKRFAEIFLDPMVSGIFAGDVKELNLKESFPRIHEWEQKYGSLFRAMIALRKECRKSDGGAGGQLVGQLTSLKSGMGQLIEALYRKYLPFIQTGEEVRSVTPAERGYVVETDRCKYFADRLVLSVPAHAAASLIEPLSSTAAEHLRTIEYAPIVVIGLVYARKAFRQPPKGFGYLIPSSENKKVLGVLFCSNIFTGRVAQDQVLLRVMLGGARHPSIGHLNLEEWIRIARQEIESTFEIIEPPWDTMTRFWPAAIPQYTNDYVHHKAGLLDFLSNHPNLYVAAQYLNGIALNDCVANAKLVVDKVNL